MIHKIVAGFLLHNVVFVFLRSFRNYAASRTARKVWSHIVDKPKQVRFEGDHVCRACSMMFSNEFLYQQRYFASKRCPNCNMTDSIRELYELTPHRIPYTEKGRAIH